MINIFGIIIGLAMGAPFGQTWMAILGVIGFVLPFALPSRGDTPKPKLKKKQKVALSKEEQSQISYYAPSESKQYRTAPAPLASKEKELSNTTNIDDYHSPDSALDEDGFDISPFNGLPMSNGIEIHGNPMGHE